jgi:maleate cis-trans isomerase
MKRFFTSLLTMVFALSLVGAQNIILVSPNGANGDDAQVAFLERNGFNVEKFWPGLLSLAGQDTIDMLNAADLVIIGRKTGTT